MTPVSHHVVLGGTGVIGRATIAALRTAGLRTRSVSRRPAPDRASNTTSIAADLHDPEATMRALEGAQAAYLTVALPYSQKAWQSGWPVVMKNTIDACVAHGAHLVYFDNVYAYGMADGPMDESTPIRPSSRKGEIRASLLRMLDAAARERGLSHTIGRSADFYGPGASTSVFNAYAVDRIRQGKEPLWFLDAHQPHSMTYVPDIGRALAVLGTDPRARGTTWHLPTAPALTGADYLTIAAGKPSARVMTVTSMRIGAIFIRAARESRELEYQNTQPYVLDSTAFESRFGISPTPYAEGIRASLGHN